MQWGMPDIRSGGAPTCASILVPYWYSMLLAQAEISINGMQLSDTESESVRVAVYALACALAEDVDMADSAAVSTGYKAALLRILTLMKNH
jgi:hypothetical protein